ncbi:5-hydroxytryptamine receptor 2A [Zeugodacus cucurbitae]|uniref:5-hydroxytryptamine receptor 2A n=1 Tax=Zeugodacus cucurbitae TaxID=28588 RepID=UPI000596A66A|nr:5-hydroxytryptamine receptor 2A [Zeugodacus cucurbitae]XP_028902222.1 5-hydroxytryptamine receptor 2A [Zeugodacus cucurbitae]XP_054089866.1 5-hydroxytryptamine receptor 2A [Zeugodacus cucurbitae]
MTKHKDAHDYVFIADGSGGSSSAYVFSASINPGQLSTGNNNNNNHKSSNSRNRTYRRTPIGGAPTKRPTTAPATTPPPSTHNMLPFSFQQQQQQYEGQQENSLQQRMATKALNVTTTTATAVAATTAAIIGYGLSTVGHAEHNALGSSSAGSSNHNLQQLPRQQHQHLHRHQNSLAAAASFATSPLSATLTTTATTVLTATKAAATATATTAAENLFSGVAVGLGAMLINDTLLLDTSGNGTSVLFGDDDDANGSDLMLNGSMVNLTSGNATASDEDFGELLRMGSTSVVLGLLILITIIGNVFVIAAIILERNLQNVANYLVASLAVADLFVACLVMPLGAVYEISQGWILGPELCDIWTSCDVLCCTASILHLVAIALDRYWAVTNIDYIHSRTSNRVFLMIISVWSAAVIVSLAPQFGWKDPDYLQRIEQQKCMVSQDVSYQVFATCCTFYVPLLVILALYWKIYQTARKRIHRRRPRPIDVTGNNNQPDLAVQKKRNRLRLRIGKFGTAHAGTTAGQTTLGLVEGNSTNTVNTVEDTEFSSSNVDSKSRAGVETTTMFSNNPEEIPTTSTSQISTVSHLVALANQQHTASKTTSTVQQQQQPHKDSCSNINTITTAAISETALTPTLENNKLPAATTTTKVCIVAPNDSNGISSTPRTAANGGTPTATVANGAAEVLEDPQLQQQLQQVQQHAEIATPSVGSKTAPPAACASNATTITSISALSPQTPTTAITASSDADEHLHPLAPAATPLAAPSSCQLTPTPKLKHPQPLSSIANPVHKVTKRKETLEAKRERKAAKTLAIITGAFVICWLPFFVMALLLPLCETCEINDGLASVFLWLGYFNSTLNPVIYTIFSPEFRQAFKRILFGGHRPVHYRSGKI